MGLLLRHKLSGQAAAKAEQWRFCARYTVRLENGARPGGGRGNDGESRRLGAGAVRAGTRKHVCLPKARVEGDCWRPLRCWGCSGVGGWSGVISGDRLGVAVGLKKRLKEGWCEELSPLAISLLPLNNKSHASSVSDVCFLVTQKPARLFFPRPRGLRHSAGVSRSLAGPRRSRSDPGSTRLRHPLRPSSDPPGSRLPLSVN